jgi:hypothetical protein
LKADGWSSREGGASLVLARPSAATKQPYASDQHADRPERNGYKRENEAGPAEIVLELA